MAQLASVKRGGRANASQLKLNIDPHWLEKMYEQVNPILETAAKGIEAEAKEKAPYDPKSRRASGKRRKTDNFPTKHHRDSIYHGQVNDQKRRERAGTINLFLGTLPGKLKSYFVRTSSDRGYWLEHGTKGLSKGMAVSGASYLKLMDQSGSKKKRSKTAALILRQLRQIEGGGKPHYATPAQPHLAPAFKRWAKWIDTKIANLV